MPLNPQQIGGAFKPIFKKWSKDAMLQMHTAPFSENLPLTQMQQGTAVKFATVFSNMATEFVTELNNTILQGLVSTSNGVAPPNPIPIQPNVNGFKTVFYNGAYNAFLGMHTIPFSENLPQSQMQVITANEFGELFSQMATPFANQLISALADWMSLVPTAISSDFKPIFKKAARDAFLSMSQDQSFSEELSIGEMQLLTAIKFGDGFSDMHTEFGTKLVKTLKSSPVSITLGVGNIS